MHRYFTCVVYIFLFFSFFSSCVTHKAVPYFADFSDTASPASKKTVVFKNPTIQPNDILSITISTLDNSLVSSVNTANVTNAGAEAISGYMVDNQGMVELPFVGSIKLSGLTTKEAQDTIKYAANKLFNNPIINVRYANFKITVLGEVNRPGSYTMSSEKITLFDALGLAGDITPFGKSSSILLIRDSTEENKQMIRLNINSKDIISSPYYFLRPNDMLYIEPTQDRLINTADVSANRQRITIVTSILAGISTLILIITRL